MEVLGIGPGLPRYADVALETAMDDGDLEKEPFVVCGLRKGFVLGSPRRCSIPELPFQMSAATMEQNPGLRQIFPLPFFLVWSSSSTEYVVRISH